MKKRKELIITTIVIAVLVLVGCGGAAVTTMSTKTTKHEEGVSNQLQGEQNTIDQDSFIRENFYGKWYSNEGGLETCLTIDESQISGSPYRVVSVEQTEHPILYYQTEIYGGGFSETCRIEYSQLCSTASEIKAIIKNNKYYFNIRGEALDNHVAKYSDAISREKAQRESKGSSPNSGAGENNTDTQISKSVVNACVQDAKERFEEWFISNYSKSYVDLGLYNVRDEVRTQTTSSTVSVAFEMEIGDLAPSQPTFSVTASYTVENGKASLFSFDVR